MSQVYLLQVDFPTSGPFKEAMSESYRELAEHIAKEEGLIWKIWTENQSENRAGGWYAFRDLENLQRYQAMHTKRLESFGVKDIRAVVLEANLPLSEIDGFPIEILTR